MKTKTLFLLALCALPLTVIAQDIQNASYTASQPAVVSGSATITASNGVIVNSLATVVYQATGKITLGPGFSVVKGGKFYAMVSAQLDTDGDGIPDIWELAYGLNPNNPADASALAASGGGLTNLQAYQGGLFPLVATTLGAQVPLGSFKLILSTPGNRFYGVGSSDWALSPVPLP